MPEKKNEKICIDKEELISQVNQFVSDVLEIAEANMEVIIIDANMVDGKLAFLISAIKVKEDISFRNN